MSRPSATGGQPDMTVDELARHSGVPVRTIREYQTMRVLPPPHRRGRIGLYGDEHRRRLALIARLQQRGYSLAGIRDLLEAWDAGSNLPDLLGVDVGPAALDETPLRLTRSEFSTRLPGISAAMLRRARHVGLIQPDGPHHFIVRSPALLALVADGLDAGVRLSDMLDLVGTLQDDLGSIADRIAGQIVANVWQPLMVAGRSSDMDAFLRRGRLMLLQGVASTLADQLGDALIRRAEAVANGDELLAAIERVRVGVVTDGAGNMTRRPKP